MEYILSALVFVAVWYAFEVTRSFLFRRANKRDSEFVARHVVDAWRAQDEFVARHVERNNRIKGSGKGKLTGNYGIGGVK